MPNEDNDSSEVISHGFFLLFVPHLLDLKSFKRKKEKKLPGPSQEILFFFVQNLQVIIVSSCCLSGGRCPDVGEWHLQ